MSRFSIKAVQQALHDTVTNPTRFAARLHEITGYRGNPRDLHVYLMKHFPEHAANYANTMLSALHREKQEMDLIQDAFDTLMLRSKVIKAEALED